MALAIENHADNGRMCTYPRSTQFSLRWNNVRFLPATATYNNKQHRSTIEVMRIEDPAGVRARAKRRLKRRIYRSKV